MNNYAFQTKDNFRIEVKASTPRAGYNKIMSIPHLAKKVLPSFVKYNSQGIADYNWQSLK